MKKVLHKVFGNKEEHLQDDDIIHIGGVNTTGVSSETTSTGLLSTGGVSSETTSTGLSTATQVVGTTTTQEAPPIQLMGQEIVHETIHPVETEVVQPVIYRERVQTDVKQVTQPIIQKEVLPPTHESKVLPAQYRETVAPVAPVQEVHQAGHTTVAEAEKRVLYNEPVVQETVKHQAVEQVQQVIHKDVEMHHVIQTEQPIYERVVEAPRIISEERAPIERT